MEDAMKYFDLKDEDEITNKIELAIKLSRTEMLTRKEKLIVNSKFFADTIKK